MTFPASSRAHYFISVLALILAPLIIQAPELLGHLVADPAVSYADISRGLAPGPLGSFPPQPTIDPNIAFTSHALGYRAALMWLHGNVPWWNHLEGIGMPLAGEMQSAALFPLTLMLRLHNGLLWMHIVLQIIAGISTWALLRRLRCTTSAALAAGLAFEFNGTYAWLANAAFNPIAFLPMALVGIETMRERIQQGKRGGGAWLTVGIAASLYAGFPEVAYLDGLLILLWTILRMPEGNPAQRIDFLRRVVFSGALALAIAAPILVAFADYLSVAYTGDHAQGGFVTRPLEPAWILATLMPYAFGGIFQNPQYTEFWANIGGYAGYMLPALAFCGLFGTPLRKLRVGLAVWIAVTYALSYGTPGLGILFHLVPGLKYAAYYRYLPPSWEFSLGVLAALALSDLAGSHRVTALRIATIVVTTACVAAICVAYRHGLNLHSMHFRVNATVVGSALVIALLCAWLPGTPKLRAVILGTVMVYELAAWFVVPTLSLPSQGSVDQGGVRFLQANLGFQRFMTLGPIAPNYGSYFGIASLNHNDLPIPHNWAQYVTHRLAPNTPPILFTGVTRDNPHGPSPADMLVAHLDAYARLGVRYVVLPLNALDTPDYESFRQYLASGPKPQLREVYRNDMLQIFEVPDPAPYVSAPGCIVTPQSRDSMKVSCPADTHLLRLEMYMRGWDASVNGNTKPVAPSPDGLLQQIDVPKGESQVEFRFVPPYMPLALVLLMTGAILFVFDLLPLKGRTRIKHAPAA